MKVRIENIGYPVIDVHVEDLLCPDQKGKQHLLKFEEVIELNLACFECVKIGDHNYNE